MAGTPEPALTGAIATTTGTAVAPQQRVSSWRSWRTAVGLTAVAAGAAIVTGAFLPWVAAFPACSRSRACAVATAESSPQAAS